MVLVLVRAQNMKSEGGGFFQCKAYRKASKAYNRALALLSGASSAVTHAEIEAEADQLRLLLHLNLAACYLQLSEWERGLRAVEWVLQRQPDNPKAVLRHARLLMGAGRLTDAVSPLRRAKQLSQGSSAVRAAFAEYARRREALQKSERSLYTSMMTTNT
jgi:tetratricopeptide (TPR) repeat protein